MEPLELAGHVKRAIEENQLYIIPYPEAKELLRERFKVIVDAVPAMETDPEGARKRVAALQEWASGGAKVFMPDEK
jgi:hypothetical protein